jgi:hypothetical protein
LPEEPVEEIQNEEDAASVLGLGDAPGEAPAEGAPPPVEPAPAEPAAPQPAGDRLAQPASGQPPA